MYIKVAVIVCSDINCFVYVTFWLYLCELRNGNCMLQHMIHDAAFKARTKSRKRLRDIKAVVTAGEQTKFCPMHVEYLRYDNCCMPYGHRSTLGILQTWSQQQWLSNQSLSTTITLKHLSCFSHENIELSVILILRKNSKMLRYIFRDFCLKKVLVSNFEFSSFTVFERIIELRYIRK